MSKIICDICGTSYPETATQCPVCGCVRPGDVKRVTSEVKSDGNVSTGYTYVKGGRFSKTNVKKRASTKAPATTAHRNTAQSKAQKKTNDSNRGLVITAIILLLAIIAVVIYIAVHFFNINLFPGLNQPTDYTGSSQQSDPKPSESIKDVACESIKLDASEVTFEQAGDAKLLQVSVEPKNTTDEVAFSTSDPLVAAVNSDGKITAVGKGTAIITATCGKKTIECKVTCQFTEETEPPVTQGTEPPETTAPKPNIDLNREDITFPKKNDSWVLYSGTVAKNLVTFSSNNEAIATFVDGRVIAVGPGTTTVHAEYDGQKTSCIIRCAFEDTPGVGGSGGGIQEDSDNDEPVVTNPTTPREDTGDDEPTVTTPTTPGEDTGNDEPTVTTPTTPGEDTGDDEPNTGENETYAIYTEFGDQVTDITIRETERVTLVLKNADGKVAATAVWLSSDSCCELSGSTVIGVDAGGRATISATFNMRTYSCLVRVRG